MDNNTNRTTIAHIIIDRLNLAGTKISFPENLNGDLIKEHNWAVLDPEGPKLMLNQKELFMNVCKEIDYAVSEGVAYFDDKDGSIYMQTSHINSILGEND